MEPVREADVESYFAAAKGWNDDAIQRERRTIRAQRWLLIAFGALTLLLSAALVSLIPLRRIEPYVVRVDTSTGIVDNLVRVDDAKQLTGEEAVRRYLVRRYVALRENYTRHQIEPAFREMAILTTASQREALRKEFAFASDSGPFKKFGDTGTRDIAIKSVSTVAPNVMQVRFLAVEKLYGITKTSHHVATVEFEFQRVRDKESRVLDVNPLGFAVTRYRSDVEAVRDEDARG